MAYPVRPQVPNPYQIIGQAAQQVGSDVRTYGKEQDELAERFNLMMQKRSEAEIQKKQREEDFALKKNADERAQSEADAKAKRDADRSKFFSRTPGEDGSSPYNPLELKNALATGLIDANEYKALQPKDPERFSAGGGYYEMGPDGTPKPIIAPKPERFSAGGGYYEIGEDGQPRQIVAPKPDGGDKAIRGQVVTDGNGNLIIVDPVTGTSRPVTGQNGAPVLAKGSTSIADIEAKANNSLSVLDQMVGTGKPGSPDYKPPHPGFGTVVGFMGGPGNLFGAKKEPISGTDAAGFKALLDQVQGVAFLQAFQDLKGGGAITQVEGEKATNAISRLRSSLSEEEFIRAANELKGIIRNGVQRAKMNRSGGIQNPAPSGGTPTPKTQQEYDALPSGSEYIGSDGKKKRKK